LPSPGSRSRSGDSKANYSKKAEAELRKAMHERTRGTVKSGSGKKWKSRKQAIAIGLSNARKAGVEVPPKRKVRR